MEPEDEAGRLGGVGDQAGEINLNRCVDGSTEGKLFALLENYDKDYDRQIDFPTDQLADKPTEGRTRSKGFHFQQRF